MSSNNEQLISSRITSKFAIPDDTKTLGYLRLVIDRSQSIDELIANLRAARQKYLEMPIVNINDLQVINNILNNLRMFLQYSKYHSSETPKQIKNLSEFLEQSEAVKENIQRPQSQFSQHH